MQSGLVFRNCTDPPRQRAGARSSAPGLPAAPQLNQPWSLYASLGFLFSFVAWYAHLFDPG